MPSLPDYETLRSALRAAQRDGNGGLGFHMWATIVDRRGLVHAIAYSGNAPGDQWPASRAISAQKANAANGLSLDGFALSTANLYSAERRSAGRAAPESRGVYVRDANWRER